MYERVLLYVVLNCITRSVTTANDTILDPNGYMLFCPCMGRFGNQADHFLGALAFSKAIDRTLVLPPWIEYHHDRRGSAMVPYDTYFNVSTVNLYHRAITMENFFGTIVNQVWPEGKRAAFCYTARRGPEDDSCNAKDGNPFGPFWDNFNVTFDHSEMYGPLSFDTYYQKAHLSWQEKYPPSRFPALAFTGAPASFPVQKENVELQKYFQYNDDWIGKATQWVKLNLPKGPYVGVHLRNGEDWERACQHVNSGNHLFSSPQCLGYRNENGFLSGELCLPSEQTIIKHIKKAVKKVSAVAVFVASDNDFMLATLRSKLANMGVTVARVGENGDSMSPQPHLDLAILSRSNFFIGNCVSSFTAFVKRLRDVDGLPSGFWAFPAAVMKEFRHNEL